MPFFMSATSKQTRLSSASLGIEKVLHSAFGWPAPWHLGLVVSLARFQALFPVECN